MFQHRAVLWFEDNAAVLASVIKGCSSEEEMDAGMASIHTLAAAVSTRIWFEWVESKANWADEASRLLLAGPWAAANGFRMARRSVPTWPWEADGAGRASAVREAVL